VDGGDVGDEDLRWARWELRGLVHQVPADTVGVWMLAGAHMLACVCVSVCVSSVCIRMCVYMHVHACIPACMCESARGQAYMRKSDPVEAVARAGPVASANKQLTNSIGRS